MPREDIKEEKMGQYIDILKDKDTPQIIDGKWTTYKVNDVYVGVQFYSKKDRKRGN